MIKFVSRELVRNYLKEFNDFCIKDEEEAQLLGAKSCARAILDDDNIKFAISFINGEPRTYFAINEHNEFTMFNIGCKKSFEQIRDIINIINKYYNDVDLYTSSVSTYPEATKLLKKLGFNVYKTIGIKYKWVRYGKQ